MKERNVRRLAHGLRAAGLALIVGSLTAALLHSGAASALAQVLPVPGLGTPLPEASATPTPTAAPISSRPAAPQARNEIQRGGPLTFSLTGNLTFGERNFSSTRGDASAPGGASSIAQTLATNNAGLMIQLARRTGSTTLTVGMPLGVSSAQGSNVGQVQAGYYTPHFGVQYMPQPLSALGGVPIGSTLAGFSFVFPLRGGDVSLYQGNGAVQQNAGARVYGIRARSLLGRNVVEVGAVHALRDDGLARIDSLIAGFAGDNGNLNQLFEAALQRTSSAAGAKTSSAYQYRLDYGSDAVYSTVTFRHIGDAFTSVGNGSINADDQLSAGFRSGAYSVQELFEHSGTGTQATRSRQGSFSYFHQFGRSIPISTMWSLSEQRSENAYGTAWLGSAGAQFGAGFRDLNALLSLQASRSTSDAASALGAFTYQGFLQKPFGQFVAQLQYQNLRQASADSTTRSSQTQVSLTRDWGMSSLTLSDTFTHTLTNASDTVQTAPLITVARHLSPALALAISYGLQTTHDALNPASNGRSRIFNVQLTAPFAIGNGMVAGRADPRLPATIGGSVISDIGDQGAFTAAISNGVGNVMVVLDGSQVQRTDLSGRFQFNFVPPGHHTVQIELASLPRGVTPDQPIASIDVQGGQNGQLFFRIGTYGGVQGHVMGRDSSGELVPISGAVLTVDTTGGLTTSGPDGLYGFGRLQPGAHVVAVQTSSLPANVTLSESETSQKITVRNGQIATLDFLANPLGSIAGTVVYDASLAPGSTGGVLNAYVVAEPGDYAAITNDDGSFLLDNIPAGTYSLDVDPETVPPDTGATNGPQNVTVGPSAHVEGVQFTIGRKQKAVVFSLKSSQETTASMSLRESALPPGGATEVSVDADGRARSVIVTAFDKTFALSYDKGRHKWIGTLIVPVSAAPGTATILADVDAKEKAAASTDLKIDPALPIATFTLTPRRPMRGQYVQVRARFAADVHPGDRIRWFDGQITKLTKPITGRVYEFTVKISVQPMHGLLLTGQGQLPITLR